MLRSLIVVTAGLFGCGSAPQPVGTQPSWRGSDTGDVQADKGVVFAPSTDPAARYNEPLQAPPASPLGDAMVQAVTAAAAQARVPVPAADARLFRACAELAQIVPEEGVISYSAVEFALQRNGIIEPSPHLLVVWGANYSTPHSLSGSAAHPGPAGVIDSPSLIVDQLRPRLSEILRDGRAVRFGIAAAQRGRDGLGAVVFALQGSGIATAPIPRQLEAQGKFQLHGVLDSSYRNPEILVTRENGVTERLAIDEGRFGGVKATFRCADHLGRQQIEIAASDASGATVLANFPVWCGVAPPRSLVLDATADASGVSDVANAEARLFALMNRDRQAHDLVPLVWDERLGAVAKGHSEEMRRTRTVAHVSPVTGSAADRVRAAGIHTAVVLENVARAYGIAEAHAGLMNSPGHRANLMSAAATHVGMSVVLGDDVSGRRELFVTQVFARFPPKVEVAAATELVRSRIASVRGVFVNPKLSEIAQKVAAGLASGRARDALWSAAKRQLDTMPNLYKRVGSVITAVSDLAAIEGRALLGDYQPDDVGIGVAQGKHPDIGDGAIWVVVVAAERGTAAQSAHLDSYSRTLSN